jgi:hypothetical protein
MEDETRLAVCSPRTKDPVQIPAADSESFGGIPQDGMTNQADVINPRYRSAMICAADACRRLSSVSEVVIAEKWRWASYSAA